MRYNPFKHHRRSIRLKGYDYSQEGAYYVTIVTRDRECLFGEIVDGEMQLNDAGHMIQSEWETLPNRFPNIELDEFVVMPNHFHGIILITDKTNRAITDRATTRRATTRVAPTDQPDADGSVGAGLVPAQLDAPDKHDPTLGEIVGAWKSIVTDGYIRGVRELNWQPFYRKLWQRDYYEHIVRDEGDLNRIREYIVDNPANWESDAENPNNTKIIKVE